ncbi:uncharacterized protein LOC133814824 [Humulus lupulus]|uniref:uncharacterized protein LOC133814824 n=1 Tax=Humulus lupulus TaxID=3486 RepID=UPI002B404427|nr:uncharacterized protein LOC133814824 [Humulus lupulus]
MVEFKGIKGGKHLRQGDPISPMLFVIVDYLTRMLIKASKEKDFRFHPMCKSLNLVNLCFVDDLLIFCKVNTKSVQILQRVSAEFKLSLGLSINHNKSHLYFVGLSKDAKAPILKCTNPLKYLGVPLRPTKCKATDCDIILKKIRLHLNAWASRNLSYVGRTQLVHSVLLGIRNYWMSVFLLPQSVVREIDRLCRNFLWGEKGSCSKFHLSSWEHVCRVKAYGGLGFGEELAWNKILLAKFIWAISSKQDQLWVKWVNCIYLKGAHLWECILKQDANWYWRKLIKLYRSVFGPVLEAAEVHGKLQLGKLYTHFLLGEKVVAVALAATIYYLWLNRNKCCFDNSCFSPSKIDNLIRFTVKARVLNINSRKFSSRERGKC